MSKEQSLDKEARDRLDRVDAERLSKQAEVRKLRGKLHWEGDLDEMRTDSEQLQNWYDSQYKKSKS